MKIILTGTTGFVGTEVLAQALANPHITSLIVLSRKPLPESITENPKVTVKVIDDFLTYPDSLLEELAGAEGCVWTLGLATSSSLPLYRKVNHEYTLAALEAFSRIPLAPGTPTARPFHFVYCSGAAAVRDPHKTKTLWFMGDMRRIRGDTEAALLAYHSNPQATTTSSSFQDGKGAAPATPREMEISIVRPAMVVAREWTLHSMLFSLGPSIRVDRLAGAMVELVLGFYEDGSERKSEGEGGGDGKGKGTGKHDYEDSKGNSEGQSGVRVVENWQMDGWRG
ncbi:hypothetical protein BJY00DRAFT_313037 [Aspergillus carlsbadensis]|nr:hypothetical protein BJY00DRAFT_313037 [Aspergillus carlsbadensis]